MKDSKRGDHSRSGRGADLTYVVEPRYVKNQVSKNEIKKNGHFIELENFGFEGEIVTWIQVTFKSDARAAL